MTEGTQTPGVRVRSRAPTQPAGGRAPHTNDDSWMHRGNTAAQHRTQELERQAKRRENGYMPFRFWLPAGGAGDIIILDNDLGPCFYEHAIPGPGNDWSKVTFELCPREYDICPLCAGAAGQKESYYVMFMSIIDLRPYTRKQDGKVVEYTRKLLAVKAAQQAYFQRLSERHGGNLRGVHLLMTRDAQQGANIGTPEEIEVCPEEALRASFNNPELRGQDNRVIKAAGVDLMPYEYGKLFSRPSGAELRSRYGGLAPAGSRTETASEWDQGRTTTGTAPATATTAAPAAAPIRRAAAPATTETAAAQPASTGIMRRAASSAAPADLDDEIPF